MARHEVIKNSRWVLGRPDFKTLGSLKVKHLALVAPDYARRRLEELDAT